MKKLAVITAAVAALGFVTSAYAADMPAKMAYKAPMAPPVVWNWTGCYVGVNAGGVWGKSHLNVPAYPFPDHDINASSITGGGQVGCNYQVQQFVFGVEGNWNAMHLSSDTLSGNGGTERFAATWNWDASLRGRFGYAFAGTPWMVYATGGAAWADLSNASYVPVAGGTWSSVFSGWTAGGGVEYMWTRNWILGLEYRYSAYQSKQNVFLGPTNLDLKTNAVMARLSYLFH